MHREVLSSLTSDSAEQTVTISDDSTHRKTVVTVYKRWGVVVFSYRRTELQSGVFISRVPALSKVAAYLGTIHILRQHSNLR